VRVAAAHLAPWYLCPCHEYLGSVQEAFDVAEQEGHAREALHRDPEAGCEDDCEIDCENGREGRRHSEFQK